MLLGDTNYEGSFLTDVIHRSDTTCAYVEDPLQEDVYIGWIFQIEDQCIRNEAINISDYSFDIKGCIPEHVYAGWISQIEKQCPLNESIDISDNSFDFSSEKILEMGLELKQDDADGSEYSLEDAVKFHEKTLETRDSIKDSLDLLANVVSVGYYSFIVYTCPVVGVPLVAFKVLKSYGTFDDMCNEDNTILGYTACDVVEDVLVTSALFSAGGKLAQTVYGVNPTFTQKMLLGAAEKIVRKTAFSYTQVKTPGFTQATDYAPNVAYVVVSESTKFATSTIPYPIDVLVYKSLGQVSRQMTKDWIKDKNSEGYVEPLQKGVVSSVCKMIFSDSMDNPTHAHLYKYCKEAGRRIGESLKSNPS